MAKETQLSILKKLLMVGRTASGCIPVSMDAIAEELGKKRGNGPLKATSIPVYLFELKELGAVIVNIKNNGSRKRTHVQLMNPDDFVVREHRANAKIETADVTTKPIKKMVEEEKPAPAPKKAVKKKAAKKQVKANGKGKSEDTPAKVRTSRKKATAKDETRNEKVLPVESVDAELVDEDDVNTMVELSDLVPDDADFDDIDEFEDSTGLEFNTRSMLN